MEMLIQVDPKTRFIAVQDNTRYGYDEIVGEGIGMISLRMDRSYANINGGSLATELSAIRNRLFHERDKAQRAIELYLSLNGLAHRFVALQGYSQSEWADVIIYAENGESAEYLDASIDWIKAWWNGDIFVVKKQYAVVYANVDNPEDTITQWETEDSCGGVVLTYDYTLEDFIKDGGF